MTEETLALPAPEQPLLLPAPPNAPKPSDGHRDDPRRRTQDHRDRRDRLSSSSC